MLFSALQAKGFSGPQWDRFACELARYAIGVLVAWMGSGHLFTMMRRNRIRFVPYEEEVLLLATDPDFRDGIADVAVTEALYSFRNRAREGDGWRAEPKQEYSVGFVLPMPFETPITMVDNVLLSGMSVELRTFVEIAETRYAGGRSPIAVDGWLRGLQQELPFHQRIEFDCSARYPMLGDVAISFVAGEDGVEVVLETGGGSGDLYYALYVEHTEVGQDEMFPLMREQLSKLNR